MKGYLKRPVIFLGFPRSGTTIISEIIFRQHTLAWVSNYQGKFPSSSRINLVRNLFDNDLWKVKGQKAQLNGTPLLNSYIFKPAEAYTFWDRLTKRKFSTSFLFKKEEELENVERIRSFFSQLVHYQNRSRLAFKITGPSRLTYLHSIFPDACFIHIKRAPLPTLRSLLKVGFWQKSGSSGLWWEEPELYSATEKEAIEEWDDQPAFVAALQYYKLQEKFTKEKSYCTPFIHEISYENFVERPKKIIKEILDTIGLSWDKEIENYLGRNTIYNRNDKVDYFIGPDLDDKMLKISRDGIE